MTCDSHHTTHEFCDNLAGTTREMPLLTIVTVFRNPGDLIKTNLSSLLLQEGDEVKPRFEHLLIDGGSTDSSLASAQSYAKRARHPVRVYSQADRGISHAFNIGLSKARGNWIWFLNADDFLYGSRVVADLLSQIDNLASGEEIVAGSIVFTDRSLQQNVGVMVPRIDKVAMGMYLPHPSLIASRPLFDAAGGFSESFKIGMDYEWLARVAQHPKNFLQRVKISDQFLVMYRRSGLSSTSGALVWKEFLAARLHHEGVCSALKKYAYVSAREVLVRLLGKLRGAGRGQEWSGPERSWIDRVVKTSAEEL